MTDTSGVNLRCQGSISGFVCLIFQGEELGRNLEETGVVPYWHRRRNEIMTRCHKALWYENLLPLASSLFIIILVHYHLKSDNAWTFGNDTSELQSWQNEEQIQFRKWLLSISFKLSNCFSLLSYKPQNFLKSYNFICCFNGQNLGPLTWRK